ncbi:MAG: hypothetical protein V7K48_06575 [Nostoc sp.]|uniref:hypothetical protein n=1 Tax=Nostoc sp. TaxID=1180 RepID=UPI002FF74F09
MQLATDTNFFTEWTENLPTLTDAEKQAMSDDKPLHVYARVKSNYLNLNKHRLMSEEAVKMVVLSPLLDISWILSTSF